MVRVPSFSVSDYMEGLWAWMEAAGEGFAKFDSLANWDHEGNVGALEGRLAGKAVRRAVEARKEMDTLEWLDTCYLLPVFARYTNP